MIELRYDFNTIDLASALLVGMALGVIIGFIAVGVRKSEFDKFCPKCGHRYETEEEYCSHDGSELKMIGEEK